MQRAASDRLEHRRERRRRDQRGVALVEFTFVMIFLFTIIFGLIVFGILLAKRQILTQATSESARSGVGVKYTHYKRGAAPEVLDTETVRQTAWSAANTALKSAGRQCPMLPAGASTTGTIAIDGIACSFNVYDCATATSAAPSDTVLDVADCIRVQIVLDNDKKPLAPKVLLLSEFLPGTLSSTSIVRLGNGTYT